MAMETLKKNVGKELYEEAIRWRGRDGEKTNPMSYFREVAEKEGVGPTEKELESRENHYLKRFRVQEWEQHREEKVKLWARDTYAIEALMKDCGIKIRGPEAATVEKAFTVTSVQAIFPIAYDSFIVAGMLAEPLLSNLVADTVQVSSGTADHVTMNEQAFERTTGEIGEWTRFPELSISATSVSIKLKKWGGVLKASDEAVRRARLPVFQRGLERIGRQLSNDLTDFAMDVLILGDGNSNAATTKATTTTGSPVYSDLVALMLDFPIGYSPTDLVATKESWLDLLNMPEFKDPLAGMRFQSTGTPPSPLGLRLHRWDSLGSSGWATTKVLMLDTRNALIQYQEGGITSESQRIINGQWQEITTSIYVAFAILDTDMRRVGTGW